MTFRRNKSKVYRGLMKNIYRLFKTITLTLTCLSDANLCAQESPLKIVSQELTKNLKERRDKFFDLMDRYFVLNLLPGQREKRSNDVG